MKKYLSASNLGLTLNVIGSILIALALGVLDGNRGGSTDGYSFVYSLHPYWFYTGIALLILGFILQLKPKK